MKYYLETILKIILVTISYNEVTSNRNMFSGGQEQFVGADVSSSVFGADDTDVFPVAYFDVNSDKLTDIVAVCRERTSINIFLAQNQPPYFKRAYRSDNLTERFKGKELKIISVRPGDFTGNGLADLMVTLGEDNYTNVNPNGTVTPTPVDIVFCTVNLLDKKHTLMNLNCGGPGNGAVLKNLTQEPTVLDLNGDMVLDLIGEKWTKSGNKLRMTWLSENTRDSFEWIEKPFRVIGQFSNETRRDMIPVSSNAYGDIDGDDIPELLIITKDSMTPKEKGIYYLESYEIVKDPEEQIAFQFKQPPELVDTGNRNETQILGQPMIIDFQHTGTLQHLIPFCTDLHCKNTIGIYVMDQDKALPLPLGPLTYEGLRWSFIPPPTTHHKNSSHPGGCRPFKMENLYSRALSLRVGDYNLDGFPDLLGVLRSDATGGQMRTTRAVLFENVPCVPAPESPCHYNRTFTANFNIFKDYKNVISASFYDISDNGALDVILVEMHKKMQSVQTQRFVIRAFENEMNFDASFLKVLVLTGQDCIQCDGLIPYGNVLPGATIRYSSINTKGVEESGIAVQTYRTSHMTLDLPCNVFGIGHSPNFIESLGVAVAPDAGVVYKKDWKQIIPNSQIVVIPKPVERPNRWIMKLFLTPSDVVLKTFGILVGICLVLGTLAGGLEFKERREDRRARQSEAHRLVLWMS